MTDDSQRKILSATSSARTLAGQMPGGAMTRRRFVTTAAAGASMLAMPYLGSRSARAQGGEVVMPMSGGSFMEAWQVEIIDPFTEETGINVRMVPGSMKAHAMQLLSSGGTPPFDMFIGNGDDFVRLVDSGKTLPLTAELVPSYAEVHDKFKEQWEGQGSMFDYFGIGIAYVPSEISDAPTSWKAFIDRTAAGDFGPTAIFNSLTAGVRGPEVMMTVARALTGDERNIDAAFDAVQRMKPNIYKVITSLNEPMVLMLNQEALIGPGWDGRTYIAHDESDGAVDLVTPEEGLASNGPVVSVVKGGNEDAAYQLLNYSLSAPVQKRFCERMFYGAVNSKVEYSEHLAGRIAKVDNVNVPNERFLAENLSSWIDRWNSEIAI